MTLIIFLWIIGAIIGIVIGLPEAVWCRFGASQVAAGRIAMEWMSTFVGLQGLLITIAGVGPFLLIALPASMTSTYWVVFHLVPLAWFGLNTLLVAGLSTGLLTLILGVRPRYPSTMMRYRLTNMFFAAVAIAWYVEAKNFNLFPWAFGR